MTCCVCAHTRELLLLAGCYRAGWSTTHNNPPLLSQMMMVMMAESLVVGFV